MNELLLILSIPLTFGAAVLWYKWFGKAGAYCYTVFATIAANIEVLILVNAFGMEMTLGNILFASSFLCTDILSELEGKKAANGAVKIGIATSLLFILVSQMWLMYVPSPNDFVFTSIQTIFSNSPRIMASSLVVYAVCQFMDVKIYHFIWKLTGDTDKFLWLRNNVSTMTSQLVNTVLFTLLAFAGTYDSSTIWSIIVTSYGIFFLTALFDTPALYIARRISK